MSKLRPGLINIYIIFVVDGPSAQKKLKRNSQLILITLDCSFQMESIFLTRFEKMPDLSLYILNTKQGRNGYHF